MAQKPESDLASIWADAIPLTDYLYRRIASPAFSSSSESADRDSQVSSALLGLASALQGLATVPARLKSTEDRISNDLIAGRISAIGRRANSHRFRVLKHSHWIGSTVDWSGSSMTHGRVAYVDIRIIDQAPPDAKVGEPAKEYQNTKDVVEAAILSYSAEDPELSARPEIRFRAYRVFIRERGFDPHRDRGFSTKTFEAYEKKFRNKNTGQ